MKRKKGAYHTELQTSVYHLYPDCTKGDNIEKRNVISGAGGLKLCEECRNRRGY